MQNLAQAVEYIPSSARAVVLSGGDEGAAVAALLAARGASVYLSNAAIVPLRVVIDERPLAGYCSENIQQGSPDEEDMSRSDFLIVCGRSKNIKKELDQVARAVRPGHTVLIVDAPILTAFELSHRLSQLRKRMAVTIIETGPLFHKSSLSGGNLFIEGMANKVPISGRTVNETRTGLSGARQFIDGLVPASNVLERMMSDCGMLLRTALKLFVVMGSTTGSGEKEKVSFTAAELAVLAAMESELQSLGKLFNVAVNTAGPSYDEVSDSLEHEQAELAYAVITNLVMLSDLARMAYHPVPTMDSVIELASVTLSRDLRKEGRQLSDTGLVGMDAREIIELINS